MKDMTRRTYCFNENWRFSKLTENYELLSPDINTLVFDDSSWKTINLPHTWNYSDCTGCSRDLANCEGGYYRGIGAYRKKAFLSKEYYSEKSVFIEFEGANTATEVYINGRFAGEHEGGYSAFRFDITDYIIIGGENLFTVIVDNSPSSYIAPITNQGDFTKMGGIYRDVKLISVDPVHIDLMDFGSSGVFITPQNICERSAEVNISIRLANDSESDKNVKVSAEVLEMNGACSGKFELETIAYAMDIQQIGITLRVEDPVFWNGVKDPYIYTARIIISANGGISDGIEQTFGIRSCDISAENGFFLNGNYLDLRGVNYHQDSYECGWAMTDSMRERDYNMIREMGCTAVRMAHYQHDAYEYDLCDRLGLAVWTEIGIVNRMSAEDGSCPHVSDEFIRNAKCQLTELIRQNYNHPSVIVWGITNELYQMSDEIFGVYTELSELAESEDATRPTVYADSQFWGRFLELPTKAVGYNRYFGWYKDAGSSDEFGKWLDLYHSTKEKRPVCVSEYGGGGAISQFKDNVCWDDIDPWGERHYQNYQSVMHERIWEQFSQRRYLWGKFVWCMFDFPSAGRREGDTIGLNDKGLVTRDRKPKDAYYFYKSVWNSGNMLHLTEKGFIRRPFIIPQIKAYSNADSAELFINGISHGRIYREELDNGLSTVYVWNNSELMIGYENTVEVKAFFNDGTVIEDSAVWIGLESDG